MAEAKFTYFAFISYNSTDFRWGKRLERKLAGYRMPATLCSERGWERKPINPIFFAPYDIQPGDLNEEIKARLRASKNLIVICSPNSAKSQWVGREIRYFHELGRDEHIYFFIVKGEPHSQDPAQECFNPIVEELHIPEILGANIHEKVHILPYLNRQRAYVQLVSKLLGVEFDSIWQRHKRRIRRRVWMICSLIAALIIAFACIIQMYRPFDVRLSLRESQPVSSSLPTMQNAVVTLYYGSDSITKQIDSSLSVLFSELPHSLTQQPQRIVVRCLDFLPLDTMVMLSTNMHLPLTRDRNLYGNIETFIVQPDLSPAANREFEIDDRLHVTADERGYIHLDIPLEEQRPYYTIRCIGTNWHDTIFMPCTMPNYILLHK